MLTKMQFKIMSATLLLGALALSPNALAEGAPENSARAASDAYNKGDYVTAVAGYDSAWNAGLKNGHIAYNLGLAYYRQNRLGEAMAAMLAARELLPRDPDVAANLGFFTKKIADRLVPELSEGAGGAATAWIDALTAREYGWAAAISFSILGVLLLITQLAPKMSHLAKPVSFGALLPFLLLTLMAVRAERTVTWGAVISDAAKVRSGPNSEQKTLFELKMGAPFATSAVQDGYVQIELSDGKKGWIAGTDVKVFR